VSEPASGYLRATFDNPPVNLLDDDTVGELTEIAGILETDPALRVTAAVRLGV